MYYYILRAKIKVLYKLQAHVMCVHKYVPPPKDFYYVPGHKYYCFKSMYV